MEISGYLIDIENTIKKIRKKGYKTLVVQLPEGLKRSIFPLVEFLEMKTDATVIVSADPCFGACDVVNYELKYMGVDCVVHIGHTAISDVKNFSIPTIYVNAYSIIDVSNVVEQAIPWLVGKKIGLITTAQHLPTLDTIKKILKKHSYESFIAEGDKRISAKGQILGCNFSAGTKIAENVDSFLFLGSGTFHPVGLLMSTGKPVIAVDPYTNTIKKQILHQRYSAIIACQNAQRFGILIGVKHGQQRINLAHEIQQMINSTGRKSMLISMNEFSPLSLQGFEIDCYVSTACPRIAIDDYLLYKKPIITPIELEIVLGKRNWEKYIFDEMLS
jgi:2-(3-amino-3-carboxypropyl)histidine synthase